MLNYQLGGEGLEYLGISSNETEMDVALPRCGQSHTPLWMLASANHVSNLYTIALAAKAAGEPRAAFIPPSRA
jgi:hypothetical protein